MRIVTLIVVHCSAVRPGEQSSAKDIDRWHREKGWRCGIGYHYVVRRDGTIETGRPLSMVGAHCVNHNLHSIGVCYEGGLDEKGCPADTRTAEQKIALRKLLERLHAKFPGVLIAGHNTFNPMKTCPCFDVISEYADLEP